MNSNLRQMIKIIFPTVKNTDILYAHVIQDKKIKARISITLKDETHYLTVKMGHKNSVHQEKKENFLNFCNDIPTDARNAFLKFLYGDGTIDGTGKLINRVNEKEAIKRFSQGEALFVCGNRRMQINVIVTEDELESFGTGGGF